VDAHQLRSTSYFACSIGAASEMTLLAEREQARTDLVAASHSLRVLLVTLSLPLLLQVMGMAGDGPRGLPPVLGAVDPLGLLGLGALTLGGVALMLRTGRPNPWFLGALGMAMALTASGHFWSAIPAGLINAAQLAIGVSLGARFQPAFLHVAPRWMASVALGTAGLMGVCGLLGLALAWALGLPWPTMLLATAPGGIAEMAITAKVLQLGVPVVTAFQVCRLLGVLLLVAPLFRHLYPQDAAAQTRSAGGA